MRNAWLWLPEPTRGSPATYGIDLLGAWQELRATNSPKLRVSHDFRSTSVRLPLDFLRTEPVYSTFPGRLKTRPNARARPRKRGAPEKTWGTGLERRRATGRGTRVRGP